MTTLTCIYWGVAILSFLGVFLYAKLKNPFFLNGTIKIGIFNSLFLALFWPTTLALICVGLMINSHRVWVKI